MVYIKMAMQKAGVTYTGVLKYKVNGVSLHDLTVYIWYEVNAYKSLGPNFFKKP
jgi:hypothetical protein